MASIDDIGTPGSPLSTPPLTQWQAAVRDAVHALEAGAGGGGGTILSGTATPTGATGALGDYYLDTDDHILYGPKVAPGAAGPAETIRTTSTANYAQPRVYGMNQRFATDGFVTGIDVDVSAIAAADGWEIYLWQKSTGALLASKNFDGLTPNAWNRLLFDTPVPVSAGVTYVASFWGNTARYSSGGDYAGSTVGNIRMLADGEDGPVPVYNTVRDTFPATDQAFISIGVSAVFTPVPTQWPVALADDWTTYTPTLTGFTASSLDCAYYRSPGGLVTVTGAISVSAVSGPMGISLPVAPLRVSNGAAWVTCASSHYIGLLRCNSAATAATLWVYDAAAPYAKAAAAAVGVPAAWAAGAAFQFEITYQAAPL